MTTSNESKWKRLKNNIVMRISIMRSDNTVEYQHKSMKEKIIGIVVHIFNCDYISFLKNINQRI